MPLPGGLGPQSPLKFVLPAMIDADGVVPPVCQFVSNAAAPQVTNYALLAGVGFVLASALSPQGPAQSAEYQHGSHAQQTHVAEAAKTAVFPSVRPAVVLPSTIALTQGAPQLADFSLQAQVYKPSPATQGKVPALASAPPQILTGQYPIQPPALVWSPVSATVIVPNPIAAFFSVPQQRYADSTATLTSPLVSGNTPRLIPQVSGSQVDPSQIAPQVWASVATPPAGVSGKLGTYVTGSPQADPSQLAAQVVPTSPGVVGAVSSAEYKSGTHALALASAEAGKTQIWQSAPAPVAVLTGRVPPPISAAPQDADLSISGWSLDSSAGAFGPVPALVQGSQTDPSQIAAQVWASVVTPPPAVQSARPFFVATAQTDPSLVGHRKLIQVNSRPRSGVRSSRRRRFSALRCVRIRPFRRK